MRVLTREPVSSFARVGRRVKERLKGLWRDSDCVRDAHVAQFAALAQAVHGCWGDAELDGDLLDRKKGRYPTNVAHRTLDHRRTKILGKRR